MEFNKMEKKILESLLNETIEQSEIIIKRSRENFLNPRLPNYTEEVFEKQLKKHKATIKLCQKIVEKIQ